MTAEAAHLCSQLKVLAPLGLAVQGAVGAVLRLLPGFPCMPVTRQSPVCNTWQMLLRPHMRLTLP